MAIKLDMLRCFGIVAQTGTLAEAANRLGRTQSAVSMTLRQLEDHVGQPLFLGERKNRLSSLGQQVFALAQQQVQSFDATIREIELSAASPKGLLRIASIPSVAGLILPRVIEDMLHQHQGLRIDARDMDSAMVQEAMMLGHADIGICSGAVPLNGVRAQVMFEDRFGVVCHKGHALARTALAISLGDIPRESFIGNNLCGQIDHQHMRDLQEAAPVLAHNNTTLLSLLATGRWVTILPQTVVSGGVTDLVFIEIKDLQVRRRVTALVAERSAKNLFVDSFLTGLTSACSGLTPGDLSAQIGAEQNGSN